MTLPLDILDPAEQLARVTGKHLVMTALRSSLPSQPHVHRKPSFDLGNARSLILNKASLMMAASYLPVTGSCPSQFLLGNGTLVCGEPTS